MIRSPFFGFTRVLAVIWAAEAVAKEAATGNELIRPRTFVGWERMRKENGAIVVEEAFEDKMQKYRRQLFDRYLRYLF